MSFLQEGIANGRVRDQHEPHIAYLLQPSSYAVEDANRILSSPAFKRMFSSGATATRNLAFDVKFVCEELLRRNADAQAVIDSAAADENRRLAERTARVAVIEAQQPMFPEFATAAAIVPPETPTPTMEAAQ